MKDRSIYYRRKGKSIIIEGKDKDGSSVNIWTLPKEPIHLLQVLAKASYFPSDKLDKILQKINRLAIKKDKASKDDEKVRIVITTRTPENDAKPTKDDDIIEPDDEVLEEIGEDEK